jgi:hypothetical protein
MSYREHQRLADIQAAIDAIRSHLQRGDLSDGLICQVWRYARYDVAHHGRTECREAIPRPIPTRRLNGGCPSSCSTSYLSSISSGSSRPGAQQAATHRPRSQERKSPGNGSHSCAATGPDSNPGWSTSLMRVIRGRPAVAIKSARPRTSPASEPSSSPPTGLAGDAHATLEPRADQAPESLTWACDLWVMRTERHRTTSPAVSGAGWRNTPMPGWPSSGT